MGNQRILSSALVAVATLLNAGESAAQSDLCELPPEVAINGKAQTQAVDLRHPHYLVRITEMHRGRPISILDQRQGSQLIQRWNELTGRASSEVVGEFIAVHEDLYHEVDADSRILIDFNRNQLGKEPAEILIEGTVLTKDGKSRALEVPGYSVVGKDAKTAAIRVRSGQELAAILREFRSVWCKQREHLNRLQETAVANTASGQNLTRAIEEVTTVSRSVNAVQRQGQQLEERRDSVRIHAERLRAKPELTQSDTNQLRQLEALRQSRQDSLHNLMQQLDPQLVSLADLKARVSRLQNDNEVRTALQSQYAGRARAHLLDSRELLVILLNRLAGESGSDILAVIASYSGSDVELLRKQAQLLIKEFDELAKIEVGNQDLLLETIQRITGGLDRLSGFFSARSRTGVSLADFAKEFTRQAKESTILVGEQGVQPGDKIVLKFANQTAPNELPRSMSVVIPVAEMGLVRRVADSFLLVKRRHADDLAHDALIRRTKQNYATRLKNATTPELVAAIADTTLFLPTDVEYDPAPSISFGWTYHHRRCVDCSGMQRGIDHVIRWLSPGFALNAAFPKFETRRVRVGVRSGAVAEEELERIGRSVQFGVGGVITLFDNAVVAGFGRHLTAHKSDSYFALGFSFVKVIEGVVQGITP